MAAGLRLPLLRLAPVPLPPVLSVPTGLMGPTGPARPSRVMVLDAPPSLCRWAATVREAVEGVLLVDHQGRVVALSGWACALLRLTVEQSIGVRLVDLLHLVDFTAAGVPLADAAEQLPPLRVLRGGGPMARTLVRLRCSDGLVTFDVVGVAVAGGALAFLSEV